MYPINPPKDQFNLWMGADDVRAINSQFENLQAKVKSGEFVITASQKKEDAVDVLTITIENRGKNDSDKVKSVIVEFRDVLPSRYTETKTIVQIERAGGKLLNFRYTDVPQEFLQSLKKLGQARVAENARAAFKTGAPKP